MKQTLLVLAALLAVAGFSSALVRQDLAGSSVSLAAVPHEVWSRTVVLESGRPMKVLDVPDDRRFVLTDFWGFQHNEYRDTPGREDRFWMERDFRGGRSVVFDVLAGETPNPMSWQSGVSFQPGEAIWVRYEFQGNGKSDALRRFLFSGYFEPL